MKMCFFAENVKVSLFQFLGELESKIENVLGCYSKAQMDLKSTEIPSRLVISLLRRAYPQNKVSMNL
jgi:hypothetical protein